MEFRARPGWVEVWHHDRRCAVLDRDWLRGWLADAGSRPPLVAGEITLSWDRLIDRDGRLAITLPDVREWALSPAEMDRLRGQL